METGDPKPYTRERIEDYLLARVPTVGLIPDIIEAYLPHPKPLDWKCYEIRTSPAHPSHSGPEGIMINMYSFSRSHNAYITHYIWLEEDETDCTRVTEMRYRDMTIDNIMSAGGDTRTLRFLGTKCVCNTSARESIEKCFNRRGKSIRAKGVVVLRPGDECLEECRITNPFIRGHGRLLEHSADPTGGAFIKRVTFISEGLSPETKITLAIGKVQRPELHIVTEFDRPDSSQVDRLKE